MKMKNPREQTSRVINHVRIPIPGNTTTHMKSLLNKHAQRICRSTFLMDTCAVKSKKMPRTTVQKGLRVQTVTLIILTPVSIHVPIIQQLFEKKKSLLNKHAQRICPSTFLMDTCAVKSKKMPRVTVQKGLRVQTVSLIILTPKYIHVPIIQQLFEKKIMKNLLSLAKRRQVKDVTAC